LIKIIIKEEKRRRRKKKDKEENFKWHLEAFASELFIYILEFICILYNFN